MSLVKPKIAIIVGAGFSAGVTRGASPLVGRGSLPTLESLGSELLGFASSLNAALRSEIPFSDRVLAEAVEVLRINESRPSDVRFDFEHLISLVMIRRELFTSALAETIEDIPPGVTPPVLRCLLSLVGLLIATRIGLTETIRANRNYWYLVNDVARAQALQRRIRQFAIDFDVTFVSFNYDGLLEAFLDVLLGEQSPIVYLPELSHGVPMVMPEHVFFGRETRDFDRLQGVTTVLKPHGSVHFFQLRPELEGLLSTAQITALHPRLDLRFNPATGQRDIPFGGFWRFGDPVPFIVPPILNKESLLSTDYFREVLRLTVEALQRAEAIVSIGFSLPPSDLHVHAALELVNWSGKRLALCFLRSPTDTTERNWQRVAQGASVTILSDRGIPIASEAEINAFWDQLTVFGSGPAA